MLEVVHGEVQEAGAERLAHLFGLAIAPPGVGGEGAAAGRDGGIGMLDDAEFCLFEVLRGEMAGGDLLEGMVEGFEGGIEVGVAVGVEVEVAQGGAVAGPASVGASLLPDLFVEDLVVEEDGGNRQGGGMGVQVAYGLEGVGGEGDLGGDRPALGGDGLDGDGEVHRSEGGGCFEAGEAVVAVFSSSSTIFSEQLRMRLGLWKVKSCSLRERSLSMSRGRFFDRSLERASIILK